MAENETHDCGLTLNTYCMACDTAGVPVREYVEGLRGLLIESKKNHFHCDDSWYCCGACRSVDHGLAEGEHLRSTRDRKGDGSCDCGASDWDARVDKALVE